MSGIKLGQYVYGDTYLHLLDPRTKIISCTILVVSVIINYSWYYLSLLAFLMVIAIRISGLKLSFVWNSLRSIRYLLLVTFILQAFLIPGESLLALGQLSITREGLVLGIINTLRLLILYWGSMVLLITTSPLKLSAGIESLLLPLNKLKIPVHNFSTILGISFRFLPTLAEEVTTIKNAQKSRGAQFDSPKLMIRLKSYLAILIPLFESSLSRAEELGEAMDSRGYTGQPNQLRISSLQYKTKDIILLVFMLGVLLLGVMISLV